MEVTVELANRQREVLEALQKTWPEGERIAWSASPTWPKGHALQTQFEAMARGAPCSLPFVTRSRVNWVTFGGSHIELFEAIEDLRAWIFPNLGKEDAPALVSAETARPPLGQALIAISPSGYFRWWCTPELAKSVSRRLERQKRFVATRPEIGSGEVQPLCALRLEFVGWLRTGQWQKAAAAIDAIDRWQLDTARNTELMRVRLAYERGDMQQVLDTVDRKGLLEIAVPKRILRMILDAIYRVELQKEETEKGWKRSLEKYADNRHGALADAIVAASADLQWHPLVAYRAFIDRDVDALQALAAYGEQPLLKGMLIALEPKQAEASRSGAQKLPPESAPSIGKRFWESLSFLVHAADQRGARELISSIDIGLLNDVEWISYGPEALLELFTDPSVTQDVRKNLIAQEALTAIVDVVTGADDFPRREHGPIYTALMTTWVLAAVASLAEDDGQLLLGLVGAAMQCSEDAVRPCELGVRDWWVKRKVARRLGWLLCALDTLAELHPQPNVLQDLWLDGADIVARQGLELTVTERALWRRLGRLVELDADLINSLIPERPAGADDRQADILSGGRFKKIAVVTLQEGAGRQAVEELRARTGADVILVNSLAAGPLTRTAESADLILLVWAACKHAVSRAFDHVRERVAYVQGTGPSSIVLAAERWAERNAKSG